MLRIGRMVRLCNQSPGSTAWGCLRPLRQGAGASGLWRPLGWILWLGCSGPILTAPCLAQGQPLAAPAGKAPGTGVPSPSRSTIQTPEQKLERARLAYLRGDYAAVVSLLRPLLYPQTLFSAEEHVLLAHKLLAISSYFEHDEVAAEQEFNMLLSLRPDFTLDPVVDPLQAVAFLDEIRRRNTDRLQEVRRRQEEEDLRRRAEAEELRRAAEALAAKNTRQIYIERVIHKRFSALDLMPFGVPQLAARRRRVGLLLLSGEALLGGGSLATWVTTRLRYPNGIVPTGDVKTSEALTATYLATGALFWSLVAGGLIDSLWNARTVVELRTLKAPPQELVEGNRPVGFLWGPRSPGTERTTRPHMALLPGLVQGDPRGGPSVGLILLGAL